MFVLNWNPMSNSAVAAGALALGLAAAPASAALLDFGAALQELETGEVIETVESAEGGWMKIEVENHGGGPDVCIIFDSSEPTGGDFDLGSPNAAFGGPGLGEGGAEGADGENAEELENVLIIAENDIDEDDDGLVDVPDDEAGGGIVWIRFSHAGRLTLTLVDVDEDEAAPVLHLFNDGRLVAVVEAENLGQNSAQTLELGEHGDVDAVRIHLDGSTSIGAIHLDVPQVGVESRSWSSVKSLYE